MALIEIKDVYKDYIMYGGLVQKVLKGINLTIEKGEFVSIMGPSGSGKSTFMNILGCLDTPSSGEYRLNGNIVSHLGQDQLADIRRDEIGFVFQGFNLLSRRTIRDNVSLPLIYANVPGHERDDRANKMLKVVNLEGYEGHYPNQISGGMQQRVAIARALINHPSVIFADEPTGNLDTKNSVEIMKIFQDLNERDGKTIVMVTHEPDIARYSKRLVMIKDGIKIFDGSIAKAKKEDLL